MSNPMLGEGRRTEEVALYPPGFQDWLSQQLTAVDDAETAAASDRRKRAAATRMADELDAQLADPRSIPGVRVFVVGEIPGRDEKRLVDEHPPRKGDARDGAYGYNRDTFQVALIRACLIEPVVDAAQFDEWASTAPSSELDAVWEAVNRVQYGTVQLPKSSVASALQLRRARASTQQPATE